MTCYRQIPENLFLILVFTKEQTKSVIACYNMHIITCNNKLGLNRMEIRWEKKQPCYGKSMSTNFLGSPHKMGFVAFSCSMGNWWENLCISHMIRFANFVLCHANICVNIWCKKVNSNENILLLITLNVDILSLLTFLEVRDVKLSLYIVAGIVMVTLKKLPLICLYI